MLIKEWEIWETFASYFVDPIDDLEKAATNLVKAGLLECAFIDNGNYYWLENLKLLAGYAEITLGANRSEALINRDSPIPDGYAGEVLFDSAYFRFAELKQFARARNFPPKYIRGYLGECVLISKKYTYNVYPMIKLYSTGVILVEIRILSPDGEIGFDRFIEEYIKLYHRSFDNALIPPGLRVATKHAFSLSEKPKSSLLLGVFSYLLDRELQNNITKNKIVDNSGPFEFQHIHLWDPDIIQKEMNDKSKNTDANFNVYTISDFANDIFHAVSISIPGLRRGKSLLIKSNALLAMGSF